MKNLLASAIFICTSALVNTCFAADLSYSDFESVTSACSSTNAKFVLFIDDFPFLLASGKHTFYIIVNVEPENCVSVPLTIASGNGQFSGFIYPMQSADRLTSGSNAFPLYLGSSTQLGGEGAFGGSAGGSSGSGFPDNAQISTGENSQIVNYICNCNCENTAPIVNVPSNGSGSTVPPTVVSTVPLPSSFWTFLSGLLMFIGFSSFNKKSNTNDRI